MNAADTNVVVRLLVDDDTAQVAAADRFVRGGVWISTLVLAEVVWVLGGNYGLSVHQQADAIERLIEHPRSTQESPEIATAALKLFRARPSLRFTDCLILASARKAGHLPLGTFDRKLASLEGAQRI